MYIHPGSWAQMLSLCSSCLCLPVYPVASTWASMAAAGTQTYTHTHKCSDTCTPTHHKGLWYPALDTQPTLYLPPGLLVFQGALHRHTYVQMGLLSS